MYIQIFIFVNSFITFAAGLLSIWNKILCSRLYRYRITVKYMRF